MNNQANLLMDEYEEEASRDRFVLVDGHALIYRAYHAFPALTNPEGKLVNAVYGFTRILLTAINDFSPKYIAVAFDHKAPTKRAEAYVEYKAHRPSMPDDLKPQIEFIKELVEALNIPQFEQAGYEADDLIGTIAATLSEQANVTERGELLTTIVTGDKDMLQLIDKDTHVFIPGRGRFSRDIEYDYDKVEQKLGISTNQVIDYKALVGDASDNIPGVKGIGKKTGLKLLERYKTLDKLYEAVDAGEENDLLKGAVLKRLKDSKEMAYLSQDLATIQKDVPIEFSLEQCTVTDYDKTRVVEFFQHHDFSSLTKLLPKDNFEKGVQDALF